MNTETCHHCGALITEESGRETRYGATDRATGYKSEEILCGECASRPPENPFDWDYRRDCAEESL